MSIVLAIIGMVFVTDLVWWATADRLLQPLPRSRRWRVLLGLFMGAQVLCILWLVVGRTFVRGADASIPAWAMTGAFVWHLLVLPTVMIAALLWLTGRGMQALLNSVTDGFAGTSALPPVSPPLGEGLFSTEAKRPPAGGGETGNVATASIDTARTDDNSPSRRQFISASVVAIPPLVTVIGAGVASAQLDEFRVRRLTLDLPQLPRDLDGMTIAHVSDIHVGRFTNGRTLNRIVDATNNLRADLVLMTGDLINMNVSDLPAALDAVRRMEGRSGVYMIEGNHDLIEDGREFRRVTKASGVPLLVNESRLVRVRGFDVQLFGLRWGSGTPGDRRSAERGDGAIAASLADVVLKAPRPAAEAFPILLAHHPHALDYAAKMGIPLTLSGHTHGGQLMLTPSVGFGPWMYRYWSGPYRKGNAWGVVSNGVGNWFPLRVSAPAEIIHLTLRRGNAGGNAE